MSIILSSQLSSNYNNIIPNAFGSLLETLNVPGYTTPSSSWADKVLDVKDKINGFLNKALGKNTDIYNPNFVDDGTKVIIGSGISQENGGVGITMREPNVKQVYTQSPTASVIIKKRVFSSLQELYNPIYMDSSELWLLRATKRLVARKCKLMSDYEKLTKIEKLIDAGSFIPETLTSMLVDFSIGTDEKFTAAQEFDRIVYDKRPVKSTTYFVDPLLPIFEELGHGNGSFEITSISSFHTTLDINTPANLGSFSISIEDPYRILMITEEDIEMSIRDTILSPLINSLDNSAFQALNSAQSTDSILSNLRRESKKSQISFSVGLNGGIVAIIDAIGLQINENNLDDVPEEQSLSSNEKNLFLAIVANLNLYQQTISKTMLNSANNIATQYGDNLNDDLKYVREKLRLFYLGKYLIQPMDIVNIFIDGGTRKLGETEAVPNNGLDSLEGIANFSSNVLGLNNETGMSDDLLRQEWMQYGGDNFLNFDTFVKLRTITLSTENPTCVFVGLVESSTDTYDSKNGKTNLNISGCSNMKNLDLSRYNNSPSLDQTQGIIYDPLTPFDFEVDKATGLPTGKPKLSKTNLSLLNSGVNFYFNNGPAVGKITNEETYLNVNTQDIKKNGNNLIPIFQHFNGMKYKWKSGIVTATYNMQPTDPLSNSTISFDQLRSDVGFFASNTPFDNMDAANVLSILITGIPYNPATFLQNSNFIGAYNPDVSFNNSKMFLNSLFNTQKNSTKIIGGFIPFKTISIDPLALAQSINYQRRISDKSSELTKLRREYAKLSDLQTFGDNILEEKIKDEKQKLNDKINKLSDQLYTSFDSQSENTKLVNITGSGITTDFDSLMGDDEIENYGDRLTYLTLRRREDVVRNIDKNYFIVSDEYDKDYDIQAFVLKLKESGYNLFESSYQTVTELCRNVADTLNFEFFANTQGHIIFRPPQYNRTPRSVMEQMLNLFYNGNIQIIPDFITKLFETKEQDLKQQIEIKELEIFSECSLVGIDTPEKVCQSIKNFAPITNFVPIFADVQQAIDAEEPDTMNKNEQINMEEAIRKRSLDKLNNQIAAARLSNGGINPVTSLSDLDKIIDNQVGDASVLYKKSNERLAKLRGVKNFPSYNDVNMWAIRNGQSTPLTNKETILQRISGLVNERSKLIHLLAKTMEQNIEISNINANARPLSNNFDKENKITSFKKILEDPKGLITRLIEDDTKNLFGNMSGERFIIKDENIYTSSFKEEVPETTVVTVKGAMSVVGNNVGGYPQFTAYGVDFDLWRQYGFKSDKTYEKPFFTSATYQCAPYAMMLLNRQRKNIVTGNIEVMGNEFYQLGDVVYVANRQMLYYVTSIEHNFDFSSKFSTRLGLKYGHAPGTYIPSPLDIIGKMEIGSTAQHSSFRVRREQSDTDNLLATVVFENNSDDMFTGRFAKRNYEQLINSLLLIQGNIDPIDKLNSQRVYCMIFFGNDKLNLQSKRAENIKKWLINPTKPSDPGIKITGGMNSDNRFSNDKISKYKIDSDLVFTGMMRQDIPTEKLTNEEKELLNNQIVASQEAISLETLLNQGKKEEEIASTVRNPLFNSNLGNFQNTANLIKENTKKENLNKINFGNVIEIRLRKPPVGGWK